MISETKNISNVPLSIKVFQPILKPVLKPVCSLRHARWLSDGQRRICTRKFVTNSEIVKNIETRCSKLFNLALFIDEIWTLIQ